MKTFKLLFGIALISAIFALVSCGEGGLGSSSPGDVVKTATWNMADENYDAAVAVYVNKNGEELSEEEQAKIIAFMPEGKKEIDKKGGLKEFIILEETISEDGTTATVKGQVVYGNGEKEKGSESRLINMNGEWRIILDFGR
jgi:hypothetical protein